MSLIAIPEAPNEANLTAVARPMPDAAPVTVKTLLERFIVVVKLLSDGMSGIKLIYCCDHP